MRLRQYKSDNKKADRIEWFIIFLHCLIFSSIGRSPVFSHLTATVNGLATIRARNIQSMHLPHIDMLCTFAHLYIFVN